MYLKRARTGDDGGLTVRRAYEIFTLPEYSGGRSTFMAFMSVSLRAGVTLFQSWVRLSRTSERVSDPQRFSL